MDKTEKLIDWKEDERNDPNGDGIDDDLEHTEANPIPAGGDINARWDESESAADEAAEDEELKVGEKERNRDKKRWELDPASSEDYQDRVRDENR